MTVEPVRSRRRQGVTARLLPVVSVLAAVAAATMLPVIAAPAAWAHSSLISSSPAADSVLATPPTRVELVFNEEIRDFQPKIAITVGDDDPIEVTPVVDGATVSADLTGVQWPGGAGGGADDGTVSGGPPVAWKLGYRVVSADGHPVSGLVPFSVGDGPAPAATSAAGPTVPTGAADGSGSGSTDAGQDGSAWPWVAGVAVAVAALVAGLVLRRRRPAAGAAATAPAGTGGDPDGGPDGRASAPPAGDPGR